MTNLTDLQLLDCSVHIAHNCSGNGCDESAIRPVVQERRTTQATRAAVQHYNLEDNVLNTAKMRDSVALASFLHIPEPQDLEEVLALGKENMENDPLLY